MTFVAGAVPLYSTRSCCVGADVSFFTAEVEVSSQASDAIFSCDSATNTLSPTAFASVTGCSSGRVSVRVAAVEQQMLCHPNHPTSLRPLPPLAIQPQRHSSSCFVSKTDFPVCLVLTIAAFSAVAVSRCHSIHPMRLRHSNSPTVRPQRAFRRRVGLRP